MRIQTVGYVCFSSRSENSFLFVPLTSIVAMVGRGDRIAYVMALDSSNRNRDGLEYLGGKMEEKIQRILSLIT